MLNSIIAPATPEVAGLKALDLKPGDPIPTPAGIAWNAIHIDPALAAHLFAQNRDNNRGKHDQHLDLLVSDLRDDRWRLTPGPVVFDEDGRLIDGQHRLLAIMRSGVPAWTVVTFGWDRETIHFLDLGAKRTGGDMLRINDVKHSGLVSSTISRRFRYGDALVSGHRMVNSVISVPAVEAEFANDNAFWVHAAKVGHETHTSLRRGLTATVFAVVAALIEEVHPGTAEPFFDEVTNPTVPGSPAWEVKQRYHQARYTEREFLDRRLPIEFLIRAYNAWSGAEKKFRGYPKPGFTLSRIK
jgi:hypothetical protein